MKKELVLKVNKYLANINVNYVKLHNLHWNVLGLQFKPVHEYLESLYDSMHEVFDEVAELLKMNGEYPLASLKAFFRYLEYKEILDKNPFTKIQVRFREPIKLPKTIPLNIVELFLSTIYKQRTNAKTNYQKINALRDAAIIELLFATGIRISELCFLRTIDVNLYDGSILIYGKGHKERVIQIGNSSIIHLLQEYKNSFHNNSKDYYYFFVNQNGSVISDQSVRRMINKYASLAAIELHITPHMFRHTFATSLLEADVDIRYIQEMLGHSSINVTEIYTHVSTSKQRDILISKHPRNNFKI